MRVVEHKAVPFVVFWHGDRSGSEAVHCLQGRIGLSLEDTCQGIVCFLDLPNDNAFKLST